MHQARGGYGVLPARHLGFLQSGRLHVAHADGTEIDLDPGDAYVIEPGHDAWVVGDDRVVAYEFEPRSAAEYRRGRTDRRRAAGVTQ